MRIVTFLTAMLSPAAFAGAPELHLEYRRTGAESVAAAEKGGREELEGGNACAASFQRDLEKLAAREDLQKAATSAAQKLLVAEDPLPHLVLRLSNGSASLRFELRPDSPHAGPAAPLFRKEVVLSAKPGTWKQRLERDGCRITPAQANRLVALVAEPTRLMECKFRKIELLEPASRITRFLYEYVPDKWLEASRERVALRDPQATALLRQDQTAYRKGNMDFSACLAGLEKLEREGAASLKVLKDVADHQPHFDLPWNSMDRLQRLLDSRPNSL